MSVVRLYIIQQRAVIEVLSVYVDISDV